MGAFKAAMNLMGFGFALVFAASVADALFINPNKVAPFDLADLNRALWAEPHHSHARKKPVHKQASPAKLDTSESNH